MAKAKKTVSFEDALWGACDKLRGTVEPAEYKHVVLSLIFLKFVNDKFEARRAELLAEGKEKYLERVACAREPWCRCAPCVCLAGLQSRNQCLPFQEYATAWREGYVENKAFGIFGKLQGASANSDDYR